MREAAATPLVTVLRDRFVAASAATGALVVPLEAVLARVFGTDAHFQPATSPAAARRLSKADVGVLPISIGALALDIDAPGHVATAEWRAELAAKLVRLEQAHPGAFVYSTRGGARLIWCLAEPFELPDSAAAAEWRARYLAACELLAAGFGIECDRSCADWQRLFRLPGARRDGDYSSPTVLPIVRAIGAIELPLPPIPQSNASRPLGAPKGAPRVANAPESQAAARALHGAPSDCDAPSLGLGLFYDLLAARGDIRTAYDLGPNEPPAFIVKCPRARLHSGTDSALLVTSAAGGTGWISCKHDHCAGLEPSDWRAEFSAAELAAAGITVRRVQIGAGGVNAVGSGVRIFLALAAADGCGALPAGYLRISNGTRPWLELWPALGVVPPSDLDAAGDLGAALAECTERELLVEFDGERVRRILPAPAAELAAE